MFLLSAAALAALAGTAQAQDKQAAETPEKLPSISDKTKGTQKLDGFMPLYWQPTSGKLFMEISRFKQELLYQVSLASRPRARTRSGSTAASLVIRQWSFSTASARRFC